jgi:hypothetical protein
MDPRLIQDLKNSWRNCNAATVGFLTNIPADRLTEKPFKERFRTFAWEFACLIRTRLCYLEGLKTGELRFNDRDSIPNKDEVETKSKAEMLDTLSATTNMMIEEIEQVSIDRVGMVLWLLQHERIHHGKLMLYLSQADFDLPESFVKTWGESNFPKK